MIRIEALDELLAMNILLVGRAAVPKMRVPVDDEYLFTVSGLVHGDSPYPVTRAILASSIGRIVQSASTGTKAGPRTLRQSVFDIDQCLIHIAETNDRVVV